MGMMAKGHHNRHCNMAKADDLNWMGLNPDMVWSNGIYLFIGFCIIGNAWFHGPRAPKNKFEKYWRRSRELRKVLDDKDWVKTNPEAKVILEKEYNSLRKRVKPRLQRLVAVSEWTEQNPYAASLL